MSAEKANQVHSPDINASVQQLQNLGLIATEKMNTWRGDRLVAYIGKILDLVALGLCKDHATKTRCGRFARAPYQGSENSGQAAFAADEQKMAGIREKKIQTVGSNCPTHILLVENLQLYLNARFPGKVVGQRLVAFLQNAIWPIGENAQG